MFEIAQVFSLLLLTLARAEQLTDDAPAPISELLLNRISVPPVNWARHERVPDKNRRSDAIGLPVGNGELAIVRISPSSMPKRFKHGASSKQRQKSLRKSPTKIVTHNDLLKKHILNKIKHEKYLKKNKQVKVVRRAKRLPHGKNKKANKNKNKTGTKNKKHVVGKHHDTRKSRQAVKLFPKDLQISEEAKFKFVNDDSPALVPFYRQAVDNLKKYKKAKEKNIAKDAGQGTHIIALIHV